MQSTLNYLDFTNNDVFVGIDVHKKQWTVSIMVEDILHKKYSQDPNPLTLFKYLEKQFPNGNYHSVYEAGYCGFWIHRELKQYGIDSKVVCPADVPTSDKERRQKEDKRDSYKLVKALKSNSMEYIYIPEEKIVQDRLLIRTRNALSKDLRRSKNRVKSMLLFTGTMIPDCFENKSGYWSNRFIKWVENVKFQETSATISLQVHLNQVKYNRNQLLEITKQIRQLAQTAHYSTNIKLLTSIPGIGPLTAMKILTELDNIERFNSIDKLCSYIGFIPSTRSSGDKDITGDITPRGHHFLRESFIESAWTAIRVDPALMLKYKHLCQRMNPNKAIVRIAKKLVIRMAYVLKHNEPYVFGTMNKL